MSIAPENRTPSGNVIMGRTVVCLRCGAPVRISCEGTGTPGTSHQARLSLEREEYRRRATRVRPDNPAR
jgi:hypothetical protein